MKIKNIKRNENGFIVAFVALALTVLIGFAAMGLDISTAYAHQTRVKNATDLALLAGISQLQSVSDISAAKNTALTYLNNNLTMTISGFSTLALGSPGLTIQGGIYDLTTRTFTWDEVSSTANALKLTYTYSSPAYLAEIFMINSINVNSTSIVAKQPAGSMPPGTGAPLTLSTTALDTAISNSYMVDLTPGDNASWTLYNGSNPSTEALSDAIAYLNNPLTGTPSDGSYTGESIGTNNGSMTSLYSDMVPLIGRTFFLAVTDSPSSNITVKGIVAGRIDAVVNSMGTRYVSITIIPNQIANSFNGLTLGNGASSTLTATQQAVLASSFGLVE